MTYNFTQISSTVSTFSRHALFDRAPAITCRFRLFCQKTKVCSSLSLAWVILYCQACFCALLCDSMTPRSVFSRTLFSFMHSWTKYAHLYYRAMAFLTAGLAGYGFQIGIFHGYHGRLLHRLDNLRDCCWIFPPRSASHDLPCTWYVILKLAYFVSHSEDHAQNSLFKYVISLKM